MITVKNVILRVACLMALFVLVVSRDLQKRTQKDLKAIPSLKQNGKELVSIVQVEGKEYFVDPNYTNVSWVEVQQYCKEFNMTVGETVTANQNQQVYLMTPLFYNYWLGGTDAEVDGEWYWITDKIPFNSVNWGFGEPGISQTKNCLFMIEDLRSWWTVGCSDQDGEIEEIYVLCEQIL